MRADLLDLWRGCRGRLLAALQAGGGDEADLCAELSAGRAQLWIAGRSALATQCVSGPAGRELHIWLAGGDLEEILTLAPGVEAWARGQGCVRVTLEGRPGWTRALRPLGYRSNGRELERRL